MPEKIEVPVHKEARAFLCPANNALSGKGMNRYSPANPDFRIK
jgi:hypothetical protein